MLPNADRAHVDLRKLRDYSLSSAHDVGQHKARVFRAALGLGAADAEWLRDRILEGVRSAQAVETGIFPYGVLYRVDIPVETETGAATVRTGWIVRSHESFPRLTTCYVVS
ncbi:DUF6883 domain-containing protein [Rubrivirga sp. IMCC43871]|uniref:DUF6883 domain-containing protein n=1 Tax=Rubrivirga sp. IMCC43871 TaxID=3391575 RepID=UPI0039901593